MLLYFKCNYGIGLFFTLRKYFANVILLIYFKLKAAGCKSSFEKKLRKGMEYI